MSGLAAVSPKQQFKSALGIPLVGGTVDVFLSGTTTRTNTWQDKALTSLNTNPITLDSRGECLLWLDPTITYKLVLKDVLGVTQWTVDNVAGPFDASNLAFTQAGTSMVPRTSQSKLREIEISITDAGAVVDGVTDDFIAINVAISAVAVAGGGIVKIPPGVGGAGAAISDQIILPHSVRFVSDGKRAGGLVAMSTFPTTKSMVQLGTTSVFAFDCRCEDMFLDCNSRAPKGITSATAQEGSGARNVLVTGYTATGIDFDETTGSLFCDHYQIQDTELYCAIGATSTIGFHYKGLKNGGQIYRMTVNPNGVTTQNYGVHIEGTGAAGCHVQIIGLNVERHADGVFVDTNGGATIIGVSLLTAGTNTVRINTLQSVEVLHALKGAATNTINNTTLSDTITDARVGSYIQVAAGAGTQAFYTGGRTGTTASVSGADNPVHTVKTTSTSTGTQKARYRLLDGNNDGWALQFAGNGLNDPFELIPITAGSDGSVVFRVTDLGAIQAMQTTNGPAGSITLGAAASTVVSNTSVTANSKVYLQATNAAAATLMSGSKALYHDTTVNSAGGSFTVKTADATAAAGTETFSYWMVN